MGDWFRGGRRLSESPCKKVVTRAELQRQLKARIEKGDQDAEREWERWKEVDRLFDVFREKPLYPPKNNDSKNQSVK